MRVWRRKSGVRWKYPLTTAWTSWGIRRTKARRYFARNLLTQTLTHITIVSMDWVSQSSIYWLPTLKKPKNSSKFDYKIFCFKFVQKQ